MIKRLIKSNKIIFEDSIRYKNKIYSKVNANEFNILNFNENDMSEGWDEKYKDVLIAIKNDEKIRLWKIIEIEPSYEIKGIQYTFFIENMNSKVADTLNFDELNTYHKNGTLEIYE